MPSTLHCVFRVAAGPRIGFGHLMRARALARALGVSPRVSLRGGQVASRVARRLGCVLLPSGMDALRGANVIVVDDPSARHADVWLARARRLRVPSVAVCDRRHSVADLMVDGLATETAGSTRALAGSRFYILDPRLVRQRHASARLRRGGRVVIALGGGRHVLDVAGRLVDAIRRRCPDATIAVAPGFSSRRPPALAGARWLPSRNLARPLSTCDVAVLAGGVTLHEGCALGVPIVGLAVVPGQHATIAAFAARGAVLDAGRHRTADRAINHAALGVHHLLSDARQRRRVAAAARRLVDGQGARRVAGEIRALCEGKGVSRV